MLHMCCPRAAPLMPYLLTPEAKARIMHGEAALQQQQHLSAAAMQVSGGQGPCTEPAGGWQGWWIGKGLHAGRQPEACSPCVPTRTAATPSPAFTPRRLQALFQGVNPASVAFLHISVRRTHVVEDALNQVRHVRATGHVTRAAAVGTGMAAEQQAGRRQRRTHVLHLPASLPPSLEHLPSQAGAPCRGPEEAPQGV